MNALGIVIDGESYGGSDLVWLIVGLLLIVALILYIAGRVR